ncbi:uncharacterized protein LOC141633279 [Silene latifolia]|uniref:uncharacterized protein LOC141633279 n=1 Tax=Silene latifolia TaxID=37657 RepID=UPI003D7876BC
MSTEVPYFDIAYMKGMFWVVDRKDKKRYSLRVNTDSYMKLPANGRLPETSHLLELAPPCPPARSYLIPKSLTYTLDSEAVREETTPRLIFDPPRTSPHAPSSFYVPMPSPPFDHPRHSTYAPSSSFTHEPSSYHEQPRNSMHMPSFTRGYNQPSSTYNHQYPMSDLIEKVNNSLVLRDVHEFTYNQGIRPKECPSFWSGDGDTSGVFKAYGIQPSDWGHRVPHGDGHLLGPWAGPHYTTGSFFNDTHQGVGYQENVSGDYQGNVNSTYNEEVGGVSYEGEGNVFYRSESGGGGASIWAPGLMEHNGLYINAIVEDASMNTSGDTRSEELSIQRKESPVSNQGALVQWVKGLGKRRKSSS